jgi:MOSC domain-containing protein YiiM
VSSQATAEVLSVNVGQPREFELKGKIQRSAIWKYPVTGRLAVKGVNIAGDDQADRKVHGGSDKSIYAYAREDYLFWEDRLGVPLDPGTFGDNLTVVGLDINESLVGEQWRIGTATLEVTQPRLPCFKLGFRMGDAKFPNAFSTAARWGTYLTIVEEGEIGAGDLIQVISRPDHNVSVALIGHVYYRDHSRAHELLASPTLPDGWKQWAEHTVAKLPG